MQRVLDERERFLRFLVVGCIAASVNVLFGIILGGVMRY
jgi:putative flippase GtrA